MIKAMEDFYTFSKDLLTESRPRFVWMCPPELFGLAYIQKHVLRHCKDMFNWFCHGKSARDYEQSWHHFFKTRDPDDYIRIAIDGSAHDSHQHHTLITAIDHTYWRRIFEPLFDILRIQPSVRDMFKEQIFQLKAKVKLLTKTNGSNTTIATAQVKGTTFSGHPTLTTLGNTLRVGSYILYILMKCKIQDTEFLLWVAGDDVCLFLPKHHWVVFEREFWRYYSSSKSKKAYGLGQCAKMLDVGKSYEIDFVSKRSIRICVNKIKMVRDFKKLLTKGRYYSGSGQQYIRDPRTHSYAMGTCELEWARNTVWYREIVDARVRIGRATQLTDKSTSELDNRYIAVRMKSELTSCGRQELDSISRSTGVYDMDIINVIGQFQNVKCIGDIVRVPERLVEGYQTGNDTYSSVRLIGSVCARSPSRRLCVYTKIMKKNAKNKNRPVKPGNTRNSKKISSNPFTNTGYNYSLKGSGRRNINSVNRVGKLMSVKTNGAMSKAYKHWVNPFSNPIVRHPLATGEPTALYEKRLVVTVPSTASGAASIRVTIDADLAYTIDHNTGVINTAGLNAGTWTTLGASNAIASEGIWITNVTMRYKYIGPVVNRGGLCYHVQSGLGSGVGLDIAQATNDPFGFIIPVEEKYIYVRMVNHNRYKRGITESSVLETLHTYFTGLPSSSSCIQAELYISAEFLPTNEMRPYVQVSHVNRMTIAENMMFEAAITQPKASQKAHENGDAEKSDSSHKAEDAKPPGAVSVSLAPKSNSIPKDYKISKKSNTIRNDVGTSKSVGNDNFPKVGSDIKVSNKANITKNSTKIDYGGNVTISNNRTSSAIPTNNVAAINKNNTNITNNATNEKFSNLKVSNNTSSNNCTKTPLQNCAKKDNGLDYSKWKQKGKKIVTIVGTGLTLLEATRRGLIRVAAAHRRRQREI